MHGVKVVLGYAWQNLALGCAPGLSQWNAGLQAVPTAAWPQQQCKSDKLIS